jgi:hypothetical protein
VEHVQPIERTFSWRGAALLVSLLLVIGLSGLGSVALVHRLAGTRPVSDTGHGPARQVAPAAPLRPRTRVSVLVLNGNGISGAAGTEAAQLLDRGYRSTNAVNAPAGYATSLVLFRRGWQREAERLGRDAGIRLVAPLDGTLPRADAGYQLVLVLGAARR